MGFDIECIVDISSYPGEYFCPVCRTLVYPNEALQSQCTHLYCKPCLAHVANNTRACPYDGYLVTEADSKALLESDKVLAENVGKVKVRCLFHRSGCTWEGTLSESTAHCASCTFGNSPVICNRCGIQIVHREVHDHAQTCPGVYQAQQPAVQDAVASSTAATATTAGDQNQVVAQPAPATSQAQNPQATATHHQPGQDPNQQATANSQAPSVAAAAAPTQEQWYQQYYQQYAGYEAYQQSYQQYYPYQQQVAQQYQQGQYHPQGYAQPQPQAQAQAQAQPQTQPQVQIQPQPQTHHLSQPQSQPQPNVQTQSVAQAQVPVQGQPQPQSHVQAMTPQYQNVAQVNPQQQFPPTLQPHAQGNPIQQPQPYTHPQPHPMQSQPQQYVQMPQYPQPHLQMHPPHISQSNIQANRQTQPQSASQPQPHSQAQPQLQPQPHLQNYPQSYPQSHPPQMNQSTVPNAQPQSSHIATPAVTGHQSYQPPQQTPVGAPQQHSVHPHPMTGSLPMHGQIPQQLPLMRPAPSHGPISNQQQPMVPSHGQVPSIPPHQQQFYPHAPPPGPPVQQRPGIQSLQQPMAQQSQNFPGPPQGPYSHYGQQQPMQSQLRPQGAPHAMQPGSHGYSSSMVAPSIQPQQSQNYTGRPLMPTHGAQPQSLQQAPDGYGAAAHNKPVHHASNQPFPMQNYGNRTSVAPEISHKTASAQGGTPLLNSSEKDINVDIADTIDLKAKNSETGVKDEQGTTDESSKDADREAKKDESGEAIRQQTVKAEPTEGFNPPSDGKSLGTSTVEDKDATSFASNDLPKLHDMPTGTDKDSQVAHASASSADGSDKKDPQSAFVGKDDSQHYGVDASSQHFEHSSYQQNSSMSQSKPPLGLPPPPPPRPEALAYPPTSLRPQGPEHMHPGQTLNPMDHSQPPLLKQPPDAPFGKFPVPGSTALYGEGHGNFGPRSFAHHAAPQRPPFPGVPHDPRSGITGRPPQHGPEGQFGIQDSTNPMESEFLQNQRLNRFDGNQLNSHMPGTLERGPYGRPSGIEPNNSRIHGATGLDSPAFGLRDERFNARAVEHGNPFPMEPMRPFDQGPRPLHGPNYDAGSKPGPGASGPPSRFMAPPHHSGNGINPEIAAERELPAGVHEDYRGMDPGRARPDFPKPDSAFGRHHMGHSTPRSPDREYFGMPPRGPHSFSGGPRSFNLPVDPVGNSFTENRFPAPGHHNGHLRSGNAFEQDTLPGHLRRSEMLGPQSFPGHHLGENAGFDAFPGRGRIEELGRSFPHHMPGVESFRGNHSRLGEPGFRSNYPLPGFPNDGLYAGDLEPFDKSRKRKPVCMGWCRICKVDCESAEGLDMHSQTMDHQRMAMDMVKSIKQQNRKKLKLSGEHAVVEEANKARSAGFEGRGNKA